MFLPLSLRPRAEAIRKSCNSVGLYSPFCFHTKRLRAYGIILPKGVPQFRTQLLGKLAGEADKLTPLSQELFQQLAAEFVELEQRLAGDTDKREAMAQAHPECRRLMTIPGLGPLTATALLAAVRDAHAFKNGRQFAAWLG